MPRISLAEVDQSFKNSGEAFDVIDAQAALDLDYGSDYYVPFSPDSPDWDDVPFSLDWDDDDYCCDDDFGNDYDYEYERFYDEIDFT